MCAKGVISVTTTWGLKVQELLKEAGKTPAWLAREAKIGRSTVINWINNPNGVTPKPEQIAKVAKAFNKTARELAPYGGYPIVQSSDEGERLARIKAIETTPREARLLGDLRRLSPRDQDTVLSLVEAWVKMRGGDDTDQQGSQ